MEKVKFIILRAMKGFTNMSNEFKLNYVTDKFERNLIRKEGVSINSNKAKWLITNYKRPGKESVYMKALKRWGYWLSQEVWVIYIIDNDHGNLLLGGGEISEQI